jgi:hypothetical protein
MKTIAAVGRATPHEIDSADIVCRLAIALLPFILLAINDNWIFQRPTSIDRWVYSGFHLHLPEFLQTFGETYYASRLPWTVAGWLVHSAFDDATALCVLHFAVFYVAVFSLYAAIRIIFANTVAAAAVAVLFGTNANFLVAVGWDYVDGAALACMLVCFAALASAAIRPRWRLAAVIWGVAACAMVSMYILLVLLVPVQIGMFLLLNRVRGKRSVGTTAIWFVVGGASAVLLLGLINWLMGGPFLYILNQIRILTAVANNRFRYDTSFVMWLSQARWLIVMAVAFAFSCAYVGLHLQSEAKKIRDRDRVSAADAQVSLFICCVGDISASLIFMLLQADHFYVLQMEYNADALLPFAYLTVGGALAIMIRPSGNDRRQYGFLAAVVAITLVPWGLATVGHIFPRGDLFGDLSLEIGWVIAASLLLVVVVQRPYRLWGAALMIGLLSFINLDTQTTAAQDTDLSFRVGYPPNPAYRRQTLAVFDASRAVSSYNRDARARFWFDSEDPQAQLLRDVVSSYLYAYSLVNDQFPRLVATDGRRSSVAPGQRIILLSSKEEDPVALANATVADQNILFEQEAKVEIRRLGVAFNIIVTDVKLRPNAMAHPRSLSLDTMRRASEAASLQRGASGIAFRSVSDPWAYLARMPLSVGCLEGGGWVAADIDVTHGTVGVGVLNRKGDDFLVSNSAVARDEVRTVFLRLDSFAAAGDLILRNGNRSFRSEGTLRAVRIAADDGQTPAVCDSNPAATTAMAHARSLSLETMTIGSPGASLQANASGVTFRSAPAPWAYIGRMPLLAGCLDGGGWIAADMNLTHGTAGIGVLNHKGDDFLDSDSVVASDKIQTIVLRVDSFAAAGDLVLRNWDEKSSSEGILKAVRIAAENGRTAAMCDPDPTRAKAMSQARSLSIATMTRGAPGASLQPSASGVAFHSASEPLSYIGRMPLDAECVRGGGWVAADIRVTHGTIGVGVLNQKGDDFLAQSSAAIGNTTQTISLRLDSFAATGDLVLRNWDEQSSSDGVLLAVRIASESGQTPSICDSDRASTVALAQTHSHSALDLSGPATNLPLEALQPQHGGDLSSHDGSSVILTTSSQQWAYAASAPIALPPRTIGLGVVRVRLQVEEGKLGIGVLAREGSSDMLAEQAADATDAPVDIDINLADVANAGYIVFRSWSPNGVKVRARIFSIDTLLERAR